MRKYLLNSAVIGSVFGGVNLVKATRTGPRDWRLALLWLGWASSVALALGAVSQESEGKRREANHADADKNDKKQAKADKKALKKRAKARRITLNA